MNAHDFAVVVPTIGRASLERAVRSATSQTAPPAQLIVVTSGRTRISEAREDQAFVMAALRADKNIGYVTNAAVRS